MININKELIEKELIRDIKNGFNFKHISLSNKFLDNLFNKYYVIEACENFYDSEPDFDDELFHMYMDYEGSFKMTGLSFWNVVSNLDEMEDKKDAFTYSKLPHSKEELKEAYEKVKNMYSEYEPRRIKFCNWQEPYMEGNWGMSQRYVNHISKYELKNFKKLSVSKNDRIYYAKKDDEVRIYLYGRDIVNKDWWFLFKRKTQ